MGEWGFKPVPVKGKNARKRAAREESPKREARPYPSAPVSARPGSRIAATELRGYSASVPHLPFRKVGPYLPVGRPLSKSEQANHLPFVPEFIAEGQPYPRMSRDKDGSAVVRVRTDNGMTDKLKGRGIGRRDEPTYTKRQDAMRAAYGVGRPRVVTRQEYAAAKRTGRDVLKDKINDALARERAAKARGDVAAAERYRAEVRELRKVARAKA